MKTIILFIFVFFSMMAKADLSGKWSGELHYVTSDGDTFDGLCRFEIQVQSAKIFFKDLDDCSLMLKELDLSNDGQLSFKGRSLGSYKNDQLSVNEREPEYSYDFSLVMKPSGQLEIQEKLVQPARQFSSDLSGSLAATP